MGRDPKTQILSPCVKIRVELKNSDGWKKMSTPNPYISTQFFVISIGIQGQH